MALACVCTRVTSAATCRFSTCWLSAAPSSKLPGRAAGAERGHPARPGLVAIALAGAFADWRVPVDRAGPARDRLVGRIAAPAPDCDRRAPVRPVASSGLPRPLRNSPAAEPSCRRSASRHWSRGPVPTARPAAAVRRFAPRRFACYRWRDHKPTEPRYCGLQHRPMPVRPRASRPVRRPRPSAGAPA